MKVKVLQGVYEKDIQKWLDENPNIKIHFVAQSANGVYNGNMIVTIYYT